MLPDRVLRLALLALGVLALCGLVRADDVLLLEIRRFVTGAGGTIANSNDSSPSWAR